MVWIHVIQTLQHTNQGTQWFSNKWKWCKGIQEISWTYGNKIYNLYSSARVLSQLVNPIALFPNKFSSFVQSHKNLEYNVSTSSYLLAPKPIPHLLFFIFYLILFFMVITTTNITMTIVIVVIIITEFPLAWCQNKMSTIQSIGVAWSYANALFAWLNYVDRVEFVYFENHANFDNFKEI